VLGLLGRGMANKSIASKLHISESTVKSHVRNILAKLNLKSRTEAAVYSARNGFDRNI
jgi:DNA-binding NarL/FixJ family response regulator